MPEALGYTLQPSDPTAAQTPPLVIDQSHDELLAESCGTYAGITHALHIGEFFERPESLRATQSAGEPLQNGSDHRRKVLLADGLHGRMCTARLEPLGDGDQAAGRKREPVA